MWCCLTQKKIHRSHNFSQFFFLNFFNSFFLFALSPFYYKTGKMKMYATSFKTMIVDHRVCNEGAMMYIFLFRSYVNEIDIKRHVQIKSYIFHYLPSTSLEFTIINTYMNIKLYTTHTPSHTMQQKRSKVQRTNL